MRNFLILFVLVAVSFSACDTTPKTNNNPEGLSIEEMKTILTSQKWRYDVPTIMAALDSIKTQVPPSKFEIAYGGVRRVQYGVFEFTPDNIIWLDLNTGTDKMQGTWAFSPEGDYMVVTFSSSKAFPQPIMKFTKDKIHLAPQPDVGALYPKIFIPLTEGAGLPKSDSSKVNIEAPQGGE